MKHCRIILAAVLLINLIFPVYVIKADVQAETSVDQVKQFFKKIEYENYDIHYVGVYKGDKGNNKSSSKGRPVGNVSISVTISNRPILLFLSSYETVQWNIEKSSKSKIAGIILSGYYRQTLKNNEDGVPVIYISHQDGYNNYVVGSGENKEEYLKAIDMISKIAGKKPLTFQGYYNRNYFIIDGIKSLVYDEKTSTGTVRFTNIPGSKSLSKDGLTVSHTEGGAFSSSKVNVGHVSGKYYFEAELKAGARVDSWTSIGIITQYVTALYGTLLDKDYDYIYKIIDNREGPLKAENIKSGDVIGIAMDLDNSILYFSLNGKWINSCPGGFGGISLESNTSYYAAVTCGGTDKWTGHFKAKTFKYKIPKGYRPYEF